MELTIGFSPCPNDTFIFDALVNGAIDTDSIRFLPQMHDVEQLNRQSLEHTWDICKISYGVLHKLLDHYKLFNSGGALGVGVGPLLIANSQQVATVNPTMPVAIPGEHTTAHFLFATAFPEYTNKVFMPYHAIEAFVQSGAGLGVIIHENRFTYAQKGLHCLADLGALWEKQTQLPIPLGGIVIRRSIDTSIQQQIESLIQQSIRYAYTKYPVLSPFVAMHAQEMEGDVMKKHVDLYVNAYTDSLGTQGRKAVLTLLSFFDDSHAETDIFV